MNQVIYIDLCLTEGDNNRYIENLSLEVIMARVKKTISQKEQELKDIIADTRKKLSALQNRQKMDIGELAYKHGLNNFDLDVLDNAFKKLFIELKKK